MRALLLCFLLLPLTVLAEQPFQSLPELSRLAETYLIKEVGVISQGRIEITAGHLDPRLHLKPCPHDKLSAYLPTQQKPMRSTVVGIRCTNKTPWSILVPVKIKMLVNAVVAARNLSSRTTLTQSDLTIAEYDINKMPFGYSQNKAGLVGKLLTRSVKLGSPIKNNDVVLPTIVHRGDNVLITTSNSHLNVSTEGIAMVDGRAGETIRVQAKRSKRIIDGLVISPGRVSVKI